MWSKSRTNWLKGLAGFGILLSAGLAKADSMGFRLSKKENGTIRFALVAEFAKFGLDCSADYFRMKVYDQNEGTVGWYKAKSGSETFEVNKTKCNINQELAHELLEEGKVIKVVTYLKKFGTLYPVREYYRQIPCRSEYVNLDSDGHYYLMFDEQVQQATVCYPRRSGRVDPQAQYYTVSVTKDPANPYLANVSVRGVQYEQVLVKFTTSESPDSRVSFFAYAGDGVSKGSVPFRSERNPNRSMTVSGTIEGMDSRRVQNFETILYKEPTFNSMVTAKLQSDLRIRPSREEKMLGRGYYWGADIKLYVEDRDIEPNFNTHSILVQLINVQTGQVVNEKRARSYGVVSFRLEGHDVRPIVYGSNHWDNSGGLNPGENTFRVRVYDAYGQNAGIKTEPFTVLVEGTGYGN